MGSDATQSSEKSQVADRRTDVFIAGGGVAGIEALLALRDLAGDRVRVTLASPSPEFTYKPLAVEEPFSPGAGNPTRARAAGRGRRGDLRSEGTATD